MNINKARGSAVERYIVSKLRDKGFAVLRAPASGSKRKDNVPDIIALKSGVILLIEVKSRRSNNKVYISKEQVEGIKEFTRKAGGELFIAIKINKLLKFVRAQDLRETEGGNYVVDTKAIEKGIDMDDLVRYVEGKISKRLDSFF